MKIKFVDGDDSPHILFDDAPLHVGGRLDGVCAGLSGTLTRPLFEVLQALARRRCFGSGEMVTADELALDVRNVTAATIRNLLGGSLVDGVINPLIQVQEPVPSVRRGQGRGRPTGGRSRGPYLMTADPRAISFSSDHNLEDEVTQIDLSMAPPRGAEWALFEGQAMAARGDFSRAQEFLLHACSRAQELKTPVQRGLAASIWAELAYVEMELGLSRLALRAARRSSALAKDLRDQGRLLVRARMIEGHAHGQLQRGAAPAAHGAVAKAVRSSGVSLKRGHLARVRDLGKIELIGVHGQYLSRVARHDEARHYLEAALAAAGEAGSARWVQTWQGRLAENALNANRPAEAEPWIRKILESPPELAVSTSAFLCRLKARFMAATSRWDEAARAVREAHAIGVQRGMRYQIALVQEFWAATEGLWERLPEGPGGSAS